MSKEIDMPISDLYIKTCLGGALLSAGSYEFCVNLFEDMVGGFFFAFHLVNVLSILACIFAFIYVIGNKKESKLHNYFSLTFPFFSFFAMPFVINMLIFNTLVDPIPNGLKVILFVFVIFYIVLSVKKSMLVIENTPAVNDIYKTGFFECNGKVVMRKSNLVRVDETINKYPFKFIETVSIGLPFIMILGWAMVGGLYKLTPSPELTIRAFLGLLSFLVTPAMIFMVVYGVYLNYIIPKRVYGERWKEIWREVE